MSLPNGEYGWFDATRQAAAAGDMTRVKTLAAVGGAMLDLVEQMTPRDWNRMYAVVSERMDIKKKQPALALVEETTPDF